MVQERSEMYMQNLTGPTNKQKWTARKGRLEKLERSQLTLLEAPLEKLYEDARHVQPTSWQKLHETMRMTYKQQVEIMWERLANYPAVPRTN